MIDLAPFTVYTCSHFMLSVSIAFWCRFVAFICLRSGPRLQMIDFRRYQWLSSGLADKECPDLGLSFRRTNVNGEVGTSPCHRKSGRRTNMVRSRSNADRNHLSSSGREPGPQVFAGRRRPALVVTVPRSARDELALLRKDP